MTLPVILLIRAAVCLIIGLAGCIIPVIPGPPVAFIGIVLLQCTPYAVSWTLFATLAVLAIIVTIADFVIPGLSTKKFGGSKSGSIGCFIGTIAGLFIFPPFGIVIMPFLGALAGEYINKTPAPDMFKAALGALIGFITGVVMKITVCTAMIVIFIQALL